MESVGIDISAVLLGEIGSARMIHGKKKAKDAWDQGTQRAVLGTGKMSWIEPMNDLTCLDGSK